MANPVRDAVVAIAVGCLLLLVGCLPSMLNRAVQTTNDVADWADDFHAQLATEYRQAQERCLEEELADDATACIAAVRKSYAPVWDNYRRLRIAWLTMSSLLNRARMMDSDVEPGQWGKLLGEIIEYQHELSESLMLLRSNAVTNKIAN